ncbi:unnamed protein product [Rotaria socialis]|uniref:Uncharacterized protein n=1 Tax=Rotaria socialis TaxID=392032 RepID=A0A818KMU1_9BILA|nr:unnamed protein product [Rotaria socialis]CAF4853593.1 unnamed protein product [Rotaria socialis]
MFSCDEGTCYDGPPSRGHHRSCRSHRDRLYLQQMPLSTLILFSHVHLIYNDTKSEWICCNETLCPSLSNKNVIMPTSIIDNSTCRAFSSFSNQTYNSFSHMVEDIKRLTRSRSLLRWDELKTTVHCFDAVTEVSVFHIIAFWVIVKTA